MESGDDDDPINLGVLVRVSSNMLSRRLCKECTRTSIGQRRRLARPTEEHLDAMPRAMCNPRMVKTEYLPAAYAWLDVRAGKRGENACDRLTAGSVSRCLAHSDELESRLVVVDRVGGIVEVAVDRCDAGSCDKQDRQHVAGVGDRFDGAATLGVLVCCFSWRLSGVGA